MSSDSEEATEVLAPDEAFAVLGDETRMAILRRLGEADEALSFSELRARVGMRDSGQFNYHLGKLTDHFVRQTDEGYRLRQSGRRVVQAVMSGAVTETPEIELTRVEETCHFCESPLAVRYREGRIIMYCTGCDGTYDTERANDLDVPDDHGYIGDLLLPPAGVQNRSPQEVVRAGWMWANLEVMSMAADLCPRCSGPVEFDVEVCTDHVDEGLCPNCDRRMAVYLNAECTNCNHGFGGGPAIALATDATLLRFLLDHDLNPITPDSTGRMRINRVHEAYTEEMVAEDPLRVRYAFAVDGDELSITVDESFDVIEVARGRKEFDHGSK